MVGLLGLALVAATQDKFPDVPANVTSRLLIQHVNVLTCVRNEVRKDVDVLVERGKIVSIGRNLKPFEGNLTGQPAPLEKIDAKGKFLIPGLWDMHVHGTGAPGLLNVYIANGVTGVRDMFDPSLTVIKFRKDIEDGTTVGPHIIAAGKIVDGPKPIWGGSIAVSNAEEGRKAVETVIKDGSDFVKVYSLLSKDSYFAIAEEAKKRKIPFEGHVPEEVTARQASDAGQKTFEHLYGIFKATSSKAKDNTPTRLLGLPREEQRKILREMLESYDKKRASDLFKRLKKNGTWQCPTLTVLDAVYRPKESRASTEYRYDYLPVWFRNVWATYKDRFKDWNDEDHELYSRYFDLELKVVGDMHRAGVPILAGTDVMNPYCFPGFSLHDELRWMVKAGLKPYDALKTATLNPAKFLERTKDYGTVEKGKVADLVLLDADPLADIANTTKINAVIRDGILYDRAALDKLMPKNAPKARSEEKVPAIVTGFAHDH